MEDSEKITRRFMPAIIKHYRNQAGLSQQQLADSAGISKGFISSIESGRSAVSIDVLVQLADALNVPADTLIKELVDKAYGYEAARPALGKDNQP
jgi:transcriptional regulator with XRE-family HTH domain